MEPKCFKTKEYSEKSGICKRCRYYEDCGNERNSKFNPKVFK